LVVDEERTDRHQLAITDLDDGAIRFFLSAKGVSEKVKTALTEGVRRKHELEQLTAERQQCEQRIQQIGEDQARIRQNMSQLDRTSDVYKNYVKKFSDQEKEIENLRTQIASLTNREGNLRKSLEEYLMGLDLP